MRTISLIFKKELKNALRDRRTLISVVIIPLVVFPILGTLPMALIGRQERKVQEQQSKIAVVGADFPELTDFLQSTGRFVFVSETNPTQALQTGNLDCVVKIFNGLTPDSSARVLLSFDATRASSRGAVDKIRLALRSFTDSIVAERLGKIGVDPAILQPVNLEVENLASGQRLGGFIVGGLIAMMAVIGIISGAMVMAIDSTAGEKERKTLEVLLASPASRTDIVIGKYLAVLLMGMVTVILMTAGYGASFAIGFRFLPGAEISLSINASVLPVILLAMLFTAAFICALEMAIAIFARSYREAQSYLTPLPILAVLPVIFLQTAGPHPAGFLFYVPILNTMLLIRELLMGISNSGHIMSTLVSLGACALIALRFAFTIFKREAALLR